MTIQDLLYLCGFTYLNLPSYYESLLARGEAVPLSKVARAMLDIDKLGVAFCDMLTENEKQYLEKLLDSDLQIVRYANSNEGSGFVGYAFASPDGTHIVSMRGSEHKGHCVPNNVDWRDNFCAPFYGSVQYAEATQFINQFANGSLVLTGHSKGAHNALHSLSESINPSAKAFVFNGQGFARRLLTTQQVCRMRADGINYVVSDDIVGALLYHPEKREFVKYADNGSNQHSLEAYSFDEEGNPIPGHRTTRSRLIEAASRLAVVVYGSNPPKWLLGAFKLVLNEPPSCLVSQQNNSSLDTL